MEAEELVSSSTLNMIPTILGGLAQVRNSSVLGRPRQTHGRALGSQPRMDKKTQKLVISTIGNAQKVRSFVVFLFVFGLWYGFHHLQEA